MLRRASLLLLLVTTVANAQPAPCDDVSTAPRLEPTLEIADYIAALPESAPTTYRTFRGMLIEENLVVEMYPLLPAVFFDEGSSKIPERYRLRTRDELAGFTDTTIPGGTMAKYHALLDIIGIRLQRYPAARLELVGHNSGERERGETRETSQRRAETVAEYLRTTWGIDRARVTVLPPRDLPDRPSDTREPLTREENRRVEIRSSDWRILEPVVQRELRRYPQPEEVRFRIHAGVAAERIASTSIQITRGGRPWHLLPAAAGDSLSSRWNWGRNGNEIDIPDDEAPFVARLVVRTVDGGECVSTPVEIPLLIIDNARKKREMLVDRTIDRYGLLLFPFGSPDLGAANRRIIADLIVHTPVDRSRTTVTGYAAAEPDPFALSQRRADAVVAELRRLGVRGTVVAEGAGESSLHFGRSPGGRFPEERFYNRTVMVIVETPTRP